MCRSIDISIASDNGEKLYNTYNDIFMYMYNTCWVQYESIITDIILHFALVSSQQAR